MSKYLIVCGDPSGDIHSANLMKAIKQLEPNSEFIGIGGNNMIAEGLISLAKMSDVAVVGFWEVAKKYSYFKNLLNQCVEILKKGDITAFIPVDYPGFNIRLAEKAKSLSVPVYYYIAPQLWAWGKNRAKNLANVTDKLLVVFPFEVEYFNNFGIDTHFVGHPLLDNPEFASDFKTQEERNGRVAFLPGSRLQEVEKHLILFDNIYKYSISIGLKLKYSIAKSNNIPSKLFERFSKYNDVIIEEDSISVMKNATVGIIKTGTSNLESALCGMPFAMFYKTSFLTYKIAENLVNLPYISIVNILNQKFVVDEFIQNDATPNKIIDSISFIMTNSDKYIEIQNEFKNIRNLLGDGGASLRAAKIITGIN